MAACFLGNGTMLAEVFGPLSYAHAVHERKSFGAAEGDEVRFGAAGAKPPLIMPTSTCEVIAMCIKSWWHRWSQGSTKYPPPRISYTIVHNYYGPYADCSLDKGVACTQHIRPPTHTCAGHMC